MTLFSVLKINLNTLNFFTTGKYFLFSFKIHYNERTELGQLKLIK